MAKGKGKKSKSKGKKIGASNANMKKAKAPVVSPTKAIVPELPAALAEATVPTASGPEIKSDVVVTPDNENERKESKHVSGFIFMCNPTTKLECYQYRVFGLPSGKREEVEQIKPGAKLFLFDFEVKLLYGVYEATSSGKLNLEPAAFKGKFPAQVKFKIFKECLPLPATSLRSVIKENYAGSKFKQDLSGNQVNKLISAFLPLNASSSQPAPQGLTNAPLSLPMLPLAGENQFMHTGRLPAMEMPYLFGMHHTHIPPLPEHQQPIPNVQLPHSYYHRPATYGEQANFSLDHRSFHAASNYVTHATQDPLYSRYIGAPAQYSSIPNPQVPPFGMPQGLAPMLSYYSYTAANQPGR